MHVLLCAPRSDYAFAMTSGEGAILILPDGASRYELQDKQQLEEIREYVKKCALQWCRFSKQGTLYLITTVFKSKSWTLGSFYHGTHGNEILIHRQSCHSSGTDTTGASMYHWECETNVDNPVSPGNNAYLNQTVLLKGFKMTVRWDWLPIVEHAERTEWWLVCFFTSLWSTILQRWLSPVGELYSLCHRKLTNTNLCIAINYIPFRNLSQVCTVIQITVCMSKDRATLQPHHPLDTINHVLLQKVCVVNLRVYSTFNLQAWLESQCSGSRHT